MEERRKINRQHAHKDKKKSKAQKGQQNTAQPNRNADKAPVGKNQQTAKTASAPSAAADVSSDSDSESRRIQQQFSKRTIVAQNLPKFDALPTADDAGDATAASEQFSAADFSQLLAAPPTVGSHFRFASEQQWDAAATTGVEASDMFATQLFQMNVAEMEHQLLTVPFYARQQYAANIFSEAEVQRMRAKALANVRRSDEKPAPLRKSSVVSTTAATAVKQIPEPVFVFAAAPAEKEKKPPAAEAIANYSALMSASLVAAAAAAAELKPKNEDVLDNDDEQLDELLGGGGSSKTTTTTNLAKTQQPTQSSVQSVGDVVAQIAASSQPPSNASVDVLQEWLDGILDD